MRIAGSSYANPFACISAGITSLWGPAHGGASEAIIDMLQQIKDIEHIPKYMDRAKDRNDNFRLLGFGHRIFKAWDPRGKILK